MTLVQTITEGTTVHAGATGLCAGAQLRTPCGARRVENMRKGDLVVTRDTGLAPVRMVWTRTVSKAEIAADPSLAPVRLRQRAIGPMMPARPLTLGGAHRVLVPGWRLADEDDTTSCLVPARDIDVAEYPGTPDEVTYYNVVFDAPQVFAADGLPVESFTPSAERLGDVPRDVREALRAAFPDLMPDLADYPAPRYKCRERVSYIPA